MRRADMICKSCIKFDGSYCRLKPQIYFIDNPDSHWCSQGQWSEWSERFRELEPYYWGEWRQDHPIQ